MILLDLSNGRVAFDVDFTRPSNVNMNTLFTAEVTTWNNYSKLPTGASAQIIAHILQDAKKQFSN